MTLSEVFLKCVICCFLGASEKVISFIMKITDITGFKGKSKAMPKQKGIADKDIQQNYLIEQTWHLRAKSRDQYQFDYPKRLINRT